MEISVEVDKNFAGCVSGRWLKNVAARALVLMEVDDAAEVSLVITGQKEIHRLNKTFLEEDRPTDVLSFPMLEKTPKGSFVTAPDGKIHLGEIVISFPQAVSQADQQGHPVKQEIAFLTVHGLLHLLGFDHASPAEKRTMWDKQKEVMASLEKA